MCSIVGPPIAGRPLVPQPLAEDQPYPIYLDHNATTPLCDAAWDAMAAARGAWGNPSSTHAYGLDGKYHLERARASIARSLGVVAPPGAPDSATADCVILTGSGTEANNLAIIGTMRRLFSAQQLPQQQRTGLFERNVIISTVYEHPAVEEVLLRLEAEGLPQLSPTRIHGNAHGCGPGAAPPPAAHPVRVWRCPVDRRTGVIDMAALEAKLREPVLTASTSASLAATISSRSGGDSTNGPTFADTVALVTVMHANNELGSINPIASLSALVRRLCGPACVIHTDASQTIGKIPVRVDALGVDMLTMCSHKFYGPKGHGALVLRPGAERPVPVLVGAGHEHGTRPGTENTLLTCAAAGALADAVDNLDARMAHSRACRDQLLATLRAQLEVPALAGANTGARAGTTAFEIQHNGSLEHCLPNTLNVAIFCRATGLYISSARMIRELGAVVAMSAGSACHSLPDDVSAAPSAAARPEATEKGDATAGKTTAAATKTGHPMVSLPLQAVGVELDRAIGTLRLSTGCLNATVDEMVRAGKLIARACFRQMPFDGI